MSEPAPAPARSARVISVMNQKGGVGKTTTALNLGAALALRGKRTLLIDLDPQANLTHGLNRRAPGLAHCIYELLIGSKPDPHGLIMHTDHEGLDLLPSHIDVSGAEIELVPMINREGRLKRSVDVLSREYDYILIDCLPALSLLTVNALVASGEALVPLQAHPFALEGLGKLFEVVGLIREALNPALRVSGVLVTLFDGRTNVARETLERLRQDERLAPHLFETVVKVNIRIAESQNVGIPVIHYDPRSPGAVAYMALCEELLEMETSGCLASEARRRIQARAPAEAPPAVAAVEVAPAAAPAAPGDESVAAPETAAQSPPTVAAQEAVAQSPPTVAAQEAVAQSPPTVAAQEAVAQSPPTVAAPEAAVAQASCLPPAPSGPPEAATEASGAKSSVEDAPAFPPPPLRERLANANDPSLRARTPQHHFPPPTPTKQRPQ